MKKIVAILIFMTSIGCVLHKYKKSDSPFLRYLEESQTKKEIGTLYMQESFDSTILINKHNDLILRCNLQFKYSSLYSIYNYLGDSVKSKQYFHKAVAHGYFSENYNGAELERQKYLSRIDLSVINVLKYIDSIDQDARLNHYDKIEYVDSITIYLMDSLIATNNGNWLGIDKTGSIASYSMKPNKLYDKTTAIHHMEEEDNHRFFNLILKACKENNEDWSYALGIKWQQLERFKHPVYTYYDFIKLRKLKIIKDNLDLKDDETLMTIFMISTTISSYLRSGKQAIIYPAVLIKNKDYKSLGLSLLKRIKEFNVDAEATFDSSILMPMDSLEKIGNDYPFVLKIVDK